MYGEMSKLEKETHALLKYINNFFNMQLIVGFKYINFVYILMLKILLLYKFTF